MLFGKYSEIDAECQVSFIGKFLGIYDFRKTYRSVMVITVFPCKNTADRKNVKCHLCFQSEGLTAAFRKFFRTSKIRVFRLHSLTSHLSYLPFCP